MLTLAERQSALWQKLKAHFEARQKSLHKRNAQLLPQDKTNQIRGQLAELTHTLSLGEDKTTTPPEDSIKFPD